MLQPANTDTLAPHSGTSTWVAFPAALWEVIRGLLLTVLWLLEPLAQVVLGSFAVLMVASACFLRLAGALPRVRFWELIGSAAGCIAVLALLYGLMRVLSREARDP